MTKLWNASRLAVISLADFDKNSEKNTEKNTEPQPIDKRIVQRTLQTAEKMKNNLEKFQVGHACIEFEKLFWGDFCDNYLEIIKDKIVNAASYEQGEAIKKSSQR